MRDYKNIKAFQYADDLVVEVYKATAIFPQEERYGLTAQIRRAVVSCPTNIAEGASRQHKKDYLHFLYIARGSLAETGYLLNLAKRLGYLKQADFERLYPLKEEAAKTLFGLINSVEKETKFASKVFALITSAIILNLQRLG